MIRNKDVQGRGEKKMTSREVFEKEFWDHIRAQWEQVPQSIIDVCNGCGEEMAEGLKPFLYFPS